MNVSTITTSGLNVSSAHLTEFTARYQNALDDASCVAMGGSLPSGAPVEFYAEAITQAHERKIPVIFDSSGPSLLAGVKSRPELIKPNLTELNDLLGFLPASQTEIQNAAMKLHEELGTNLIVTLGKEGAIAVFGDSSYFVHPISVPTISSAGAGDGVLAGMALAYSRKESFEYGLQQGFALAGAILITLATADFRVQDYQELLPQIVIEPLK